jgi:hypothetical protein
MSIVEDAREYSSRDNLRVRALSCSASNPLWQIVFQDFVRIWSLNPKGAPRILRGGQRNWRVRS